MTNGYPPYLFGMHDRGGEHLMGQKEKAGWVLVTEAIGADPYNYWGEDYTDLTNQGLTVIVRLNNGYGSGGTLPHSSMYGDFARRCGNFAAASRGCHIWLIGNEMNLANERPGGPGGQVITPQLYASCFSQCRSRIKSRLGHEDDQVVIGAVGPWNIETKYPGNEDGDWVRYFYDILELLDGELDGISLHTYTHGQDPSLVFSESRMNAPYDKYHYHFRAYRDFMAVVPAWMTYLPVYITETDQYAAWRNANTGWVRNAYREIDDWNRDPTHQPIQALVLYRWIVGNPYDAQEIGWAIENKPGVQDDFLDAMDNEYRIVLPHAQPELWALWDEVVVPGVVGAGLEMEISVTVTNRGRRSWSSSGSDAVRMGVRWLGVGSSATDVQRFDLAGTIFPGESLAIESIRVKAPTQPGTYQLEIDMMVGESDWFATMAGGGSPAWQAQVRVGAAYRAAWQSVAAPAEGTAGQTVTMAVTVKNEGSITWPTGGANPVHLTYKWLDAQRDMVVADGLRTVLGRDIAPGEQVSLDASLMFPEQPGDYILQLDMVHEFVAWFHWKGSPVYETPVGVSSAIAEWAAEWLAYDGPERMPCGAQDTVLVEVKNVGSAPWSDSGGEAIRLGYRWLDGQGDTVAIPQAEPWTLPRTVEPGDVARLDDIPLVAPSEPGAYRLVWDLAAEEGWLSERGVAVMEVVIQITAPEYAVEWNAIRPWPPLVPPGDTVLADLRLQNRGSNAWISGGSHPVHLAYTWFTASGLLSEPWETFRMPLPRDVLPGDVVDLVSVPVNTPPVVGDYVLRWDLVAEGDFWFFRRGGAPWEISVEVSDQPNTGPWTAQASHNTEDVELAMDGKVETFWDSQAVQEPGMWFQWDLGWVAVLDRVRVLSPGRGFPTGYRLHLSEDGEAWRTVAARSKNWSDVDVAFPPTRARYVRLEQTATPSWAASWMISEISVSTTGSWLGAEASHYTNDVHEALDGDLGTAWNTRSVKQKPGMWFVVDMGSIRDIERVVLAHPGKEMARGYVVQVSVTGEAWQEVGRKADNWGTVDLSFDPVSARFVRIETTNSSPYYPWGISEFSVWRTSPSWLTGRL